VSKNSTGIEPLNWMRLVRETIKRRKQEKLTQKEHALLAGVSVPTMLEFERGATTLTLTKIIDILNVVGLVSTDKPNDNIDNFYEIAESRWAETVKDMSAECADPMFWDTVFRHRYGFFTYTFEVKSATSLNIKIDRLINIMRETPNLFDKWSPEPFRIYVKKPHLIPRIIKDKIIEQHFRNDPIKSNSPFDTSFCHSSISGLFHYHSGFEEDTGLTLGRFIDIHEPIGSAIHMLDYASRIATALTSDQNTSVALLVTYRGLTGRQLRFEGNSPLTYLCKQDSFSAKIEINPKMINATQEGIDYLADRVIDLLGAFYLQFDFYKIDKTNIRFTIEDLYKRYST
jgi:hypothetical protein